MTGGRASLVLAFVLAPLAAAAAAYNGSGAPPRTVFLDLPEDRAAPTVAMSLAPLPSGRWRVQVETTGFVFTDLCLGTADAAPIGHAHVEVNGVKVASAYQPVVDIPPLGPGRHRIAVVLRAQDHRALVAGGTLLRTEKTVVVRPDA